MIEILILSLFGFIIYIYNKKELIIFGISPRKIIQKLLGSNSQKMSNETNIKEIGFQFMKYSFLATFTVIAPVCSVIPGAFVEGIAKDLVENKPYSNVGYMSIIILIILEYLFYEISILIIKNYHIINKNKLGWIMLVHYFLINSLVFYLFWCFPLDFRNDGQLILASIVTHPICSFIFYPLGAMINYEVNKRIEKQKISEINPFQNEEES